MTRMCFESSFFTGDGGIETSSWSPSEETKLGAEKVSETSVTDSFFSVKRDVVNTLKIPLSLTWGLFIWQKLKK